MLREYIQTYTENIIRRRHRDSDTQIDILRCYGIFCVVFAHCASHGFQPISFLVTSSVYVIQIFVFCSGYFYRDTEKGVFPFLKTKVRGLLLPYFLWNLVYGIICTILNHMGIISYGYPLSFRTLFVTPWTHAAQFNLNVPAWFLPALFLASICFWILRRIFHPKTTAAEHILLIITFLISLLGLHLSRGQYHYGFSAPLIRTFVMLPYLQLGYVFRNYWQPWFTAKRSLTICIVLLLIQTSISVYTGGLSSKFVYGYFPDSPIFLLLGVFCAVLTVVLIAGIISGVLSRITVIRRLSESTMSIMMHHIFIMFLIQLIFYTIHLHTPLAGFDSEAFQSSIWSFYNFGLSTQTAQYIYIAICLIFPTLTRYCKETLLIRYYSNNRSKIS